MARRSNRPSRNGSVPPPCEKTHRIFGNFAAVPLKITLAIVRVEAVAYSMVGTGTPGTRPVQHFGWVGCTEKNVCPRLSFSYTGSKAFSPGDLLLKLVITPIPAAV